RVYLDGGPGNDRLTSAATARSILFGRSGDDTLTTSSFELSLFSEAGDDTITTTHTEFVSFDARAAPVGIRFDAAQGLLTGRGHTELHFAPGTTVQLGGSSHDDVLIGTAGVDVLEGAGGADLVRAGHGADVIAFSGADHVHGGRGNDLLHGTFVPGTAQVVDGGPGANQLLAKLSTRRPTSVWDHVLIDLGTDAFEADGKTTALAGVFTSLVLDGRATRSLTVLGTGGADSFWLHKGSPDTVVDAGAGNDVLRLGAGDDTIDGGNGNDTADAGAGNDTCTSVETPTRCETSTP
ncbi:MAG: hypothetical protein QOH37_3973, partial [Nocardioidaceae bacterium]|nr:hypothetical protein [Nocardioidaceae bacterium]